MCVECTAAQFADESLFVPMHSGVPHNGAALAMLKVTEFALKPPWAQFHCDIFCIGFLFFGLRFF